MESGAGKWDEMSGVTVGTSPWALSSSVFYGDGATGSSWQDSPANYVNSADASIRIHDPLNLSSAVAPQLSFVYRADLEGYATLSDGFLVAYSLNNGTNWTVLDANNTQGNYDGNATAPAISG